MAKKKKLLTVPKYAAHRGKDPSAVRYAIREGKLQKSITRDGNRILIDADLADKEWNTRFDPTSPDDAPNSRGSSSPAGKKKKKSEWDPEDPHDTSMLVPINVSRMRIAAHEAELARIKVEKEMGKLIPVEDIEKQWIKLATTTKTKVLGIPSKARQRIPELTDSQYAVLEQITREALEEISESNITHGSGDEELS
jgi:hypothetical protein